MVAALMVSPGRRPCITWLCDDPEYLNYAVSVDSGLLCSASAFQPETGVAVIYNSDGIFLPVKGNRFVGNKLLAGVFYIVGVQNGHLRSLDDSEIVRFTLQFWEPEIPHSEKA